ncbi:MAG: Dephospho-CoA kinase [Chlamydiia bacterium]|nr:Dephospho-CoA kinase [Chlamydiia bacterium]MCH9616479.1 Dephospho-CoA kinase [Chlamydiia bacterium]MCH9629535.1 Dephospho-CoA kinase [Chlamydiia bacterium]
MKKVAITGGLASGKTEVGRLLKEQGAYLVNADAIVHRLLTENQDVIKSVIKIFGEGIIENGVINRKKVAKIAFANREKLLALESLLHPLVYQEIEDEAKKCESDIFAAEIPLLFESKNRYNFDQTLVVHTKEELAIKRSKLTQKEYQDRMARQLPIEDKVKRATFVIENNEDLNALEKNVKEFVKTCLKKKPK